jgi:hypothetical protein
MKIEAGGHSEKLVTAYQITRCHMPEDNNLQSHRHESFVSSEFSRLASVEYQYWNGGGGRESVKQILG